MSGTIQIAQFWPVRMMTEGLPVEQEPQPQAVEARGESGRRTGFQLPQSYALLQQTFSARSNGGYSDLFYQSFDGINQSRASYNGAELINFCSYDYLGMSGDPAVARAAAEAIATYGTSVSASRLVSGERPIHRELEHAIARWIGTEDALTLVSGFSTNSDVIGHLMSADDLILYDFLVHASIREGIRLSGASARSFPHGDLGALERLLAGAGSEYRQVLIVVEGVYSMDGDIPDLTRLVEIKSRANALLMVDEAHSIGVLGATGRGISEHFGVRPEAVDLWMGTLSKAFASCGGYIAGRAELVSYLRHTAPGFVYSVGLPPPMAAAALTALQLLAAEPERVQRLQQLSQQFHRLATDRRLNTGSAHPGAAVVPIMVGEPVRTGQVARMLLDRGILALPIGFPAVPRRHSRLRFFLSCTHTEADIENAVDAVADCLAHIDSGAPLAP